MASLFTNRAIVYRAERGFRHRDVALSVGVQKMVRSDLASAGVMFTLDTESGHRGVVTITGSWGLGESVVKGRVNPDEIWVFKPTLETASAPIIRRDRGDKAIKLVYGDGNGQTVLEQPVSEADRTALVLSDDEALLLARWAVAIENHYSARAGHPTPMDIEWAKDGQSGKLYIVQARPETVHAQKQTGRLELFHFHGTGRVLARGKSVGGRIGVGVGAGDPLGERAPQLPRRRGPRRAQHRSGLGAGAQARRRRRDRTGRPHLPCRDRLARARSALRGRHRRRHPGHPQRRGGDGLVRGGGRGPRLRRQAAVRARGDRSGRAPHPARSDHAQRRGSPERLPARRPAQRRRRPGAHRVRRVELDRDPSDGAAPPGAGRAVRGGRDPEADGRVGHARRVLRGSPGDRRRPDRRGVLPAAGDRALLRLQDQRIRGPPGRPAVRAGRGQSDDRLPGRLPLLRRSLPRGLRARMRGHPPGPRRDGARATSR